MAIVYLHKKKGTGDVFYVGIGRSEKRAYSRHGRNIHWESIVKKHGFDVQITHRDICWEEACKIEIYLISFYRILFKLSNVTDGGDGMLNVKLPDCVIKKRNEKIKEAWSEERKRKYSKMVSGEKNPFYGKKHSTETKIKIQKNRTPNKFISEKHRENISKANKGRVISQETKEKISKANIGKTPHNKGKTISEETKEKIRQKVKSLYLNEDYKKMISAKMKELYNNNPLLKQNLSEKLKGRPSSRRGVKLTQEQKDNLSKLNKGKKISEEQKIKVSQFHKGRKRGEETKKRISEAIKQFHKKRQNEIHNRE